MKKKGFTLVELLGILAVLGAMLLVSVPALLKTLQNNDLKEQERFLKDLYLATESYVEMNRDQYAELKLIGGVIEVKLKELIDDTYISSTLYNPVTDATIDPADSIVVMANSDLTFAYQFYTKNETKPDLVYKDGSGANYPVLDTGMIPVTYNGTNWVKADITKEWYNYTNHNWANIVLVKETGVKTRQQYIESSMGTVINNADILAFFVWIPRYQYQIPTGTGARKINVKFISGTKSDVTSGYRLHPAFTFGTSQLKGIWMAKFEATGTATDPTVLPKQYPLTGTNLAGVFTAFKKFETVTYGLSAASDVHIMKSREWGAVAYLTNSIYGRYKADGSCITGGCEVWINNVRSGSNDRPTTGCAGTAVSAAQYKYTGTTAVCQSTNQEYNGTVGVNASTTGNIYGVYDMSGGGNEYTMSVYNKEVGYSGLDFTTLDPKYYDVYIDKVFTTACAGEICYGHALSETSGWNGDMAYTFTPPGYPFLSRGGHDDITTRAGIFSHSDGSGSLGNVNSTRPILIGL